MKGKVNNRKCGDKNGYIKLCKTHCYCVLRGKTAICVDMEQIIIVGLIGGMCGKICE